jgi:hypothetical protein
MTTQMVSIGQSIGQHLVSQKALEGWESLTLKSLEELYDFIGIARMGV